MKKLYLIRRNLEEFLGPWDKENLKEKFEQMAFGMQDEVSGHCQPWICLDRDEELKAGYPEVHVMVYDSSRVSKITINRTNITKTNLMGLVSNFIFWVMVVLVAMFIFESRDYWFSLFLKFSHAQ